MNLSVNSLIDEPDAVSSLTAADIRDLLSRAQPLLEREKNLLEISKGDVLVVGDTHGDFGAVKHIVTLWDQEKGSLVFLGDYVDRGGQQLETINFLLALKLTHPDKVFLLRGNHETPSVNSRYGFSHVCIKKFGKEARKMYDEYNNLFSYLSSSLLCRRILLLHGGIPQGLDTLEDLNVLPKGDLDADNDILGQILWNDPSELHDEFEPNWERGIHCTFGKKVFFEFLETHHLDMVIRGHEVFLEGYKYFFDRKLLSIFSSPDYRMDNKAKIAKISENVEKVELLKVEPIS